MSFEPKGNANCKSSGVSDSLQAQSFFSSAGFGVGQRPSWGTTSMFGLSRSTKQTWKPHVIVFEVAHSHQKSHSSLSDSLSCKPLFTFLFLVARVSNGIQWMIDPQNILRTHGMSSTPENVDTQRPTYESHAFCEKTTRFWCSGLWLWGASIRVWIFILLWSCFQKPCLSTVANMFFPQKFWTTKRLSISFSWVFSFSNGHVTCCLFSAEVGELSKQTAQAAAHGLCQVKQNPCSSSNDCKSLAYLFLSQLVLRFRQSEPALNTFRLKVVHVCIASQTKAPNVPKTN